MSRRAKQYVSHTAFRLHVGYRQILENARARREDAKISGMLILKMARESTEVVVDSLNDSQFGQTILFGLGGIFVEVLKVVVFRIAPLEEHDAREMVTEIRGYPVIVGRGGSPPADQDAIVRIILSTSRMMTENPQIAQVHLNPLMVYELGAWVVDARIVLTS